MTENLNPSVVTLCGKSERVEVTLRIFKVSDIGSRIHCFNGDIASAARDRTKCFTRTCFVCESSGMPTQCFVPVRRERQSPPAHSRSSPFAFQRINLYPVVVAAKAGFSLERNVREGRVRHRNELLARNPNKSGIEKRTFRYAGAIFEGLRGEREDNLRKGSLF